MADNKQLVVSLALKTGTMKQQIGAINKEVKGLEAEFKNAGAGIENFEKTSEGLNAKLKLNGQLLDKLKQKLNVYKKEQDKCTQTLDKAVSAYEKQENKVKELESALEKAKAEFGDTSKEVKDLEESLKKAQKTLETKRNSVINANNSLNQMKTNISNTESEIKSMTSNIQKLNDELENIDGSEIEDLGDDFSQANSDALDFAGNMSEVGQGLMDVGDTISEAGKKIAGALKGALDESLSFEDAMKRLQAQTGLSDEEMQNFSNSVENVYKSGFGESIDEVAEAFVKVQQYTMLSGEELESCVELALQFKDVFGTDTSETVRTVNTLMHQFGINSDQAFNLLTQGYQQGLDYSGELLDSINEYSVYFKEAGLTSTDMFNLMVDGAKSGAWNLDKIGDSIKEMNILIKDGSANESLSKLGFDAEDVANKFAQGGDVARETFYSIFKELNKIEDGVERHNIGVGLMGTMFEDLGTEAVTSLGDMSDMFNENIDSASELNEVSDTLGGTFTRISRNMQGVAKSIGDSLKPVLERVAPVVENVTTKFSNFVKENPQLVATLTLIAGSVGGLAIVFGTLLTALGMFSISWGAISGLLAGSTISFGAIAGIIAGVTGAIILLAGGIASNFDGIMSAIENLKTKFTESFGNMQSTFGIVWSVIQDIYNTVIQPLFNTIGTLIEYVINFVASIMPGISTAFQIAFEIVKAIWESVGKPIADAVLSVFQWVVQWFGENYPFIAEVFNTVMDRLKSVWDNVGKPLFDLIKSVIEYTINFITPLIQGIGIAFEVAWGIFKTSWNVTKPIIDFIIELVGRLAGACLDAGRWITDAFSNAFAEVGSWIDWAWDKISGFMDWISGLGSKIGGFLSNLNPFSNESRSMDINQNVSYSGVPTGRMYAIPNFGGIERPTLYMNRAIPNLDNIALSGSYYNVETRDSMSANNLIRQSNGFSNISSGGRRSSSFNSGVFKTLEARINANETNTNNSLNALAKAMADMSNAIRELANTKQEIPQINVIADVSLDKRNIIKNIVPDLESVLNRQNNLALR